MHSAFSFRTITLFPAAMLALFCCRLFADAPSKALRLPVSGLDGIALGSSDSERAHELVVDKSDVVKGLLDESARRLLPLEPQSWEGGKMSFKMKVDPEKQNYFTARFTGDEVNEDYLILFCEG